MRSPEIHRRFKFVLFVVLIAAATSCTRTTDLTRVEELAEGSSEQEALTAAAIALSAARSHHADAVVQQVVVDKPLLLLELARNAALAGDEKRSLDLARRAVAVTSPADQNRVIGRLAAIATCTRNVSLLTPLKPLLEHGDPAANARARVIVAYCDLAVATSTWRLVDQAERMVPLVDDTAERDNATLAIVWARSRRMSATANLGAMARCENLADRIEDAPKKVHAFGLLAESALKAGRPELAEALVGRADSALAGHSLGEAAEAFSRLALALRHDRMLSHRLIGDALDYARKSGELGRGLSNLTEENRRVLNSMASGFKARNLSHLCVAAEKLDDHGTAVRAFGECLATIRSTKDGFADEAIGSSAIFGLAEAISLMDSSKEKKAALLGLHDFALSLHEPIFRAVVLSSVADAAERVALDTGSKDFLEIAWQAVSSVPSAEVREAESVGLAHTAGRLGERDWVVKKILSRQPVSRDFELRLRSAALTGMLEKKKGWRPFDSAFVAETNVDAMPDVAHEYW